jgi:hypothetical protein
VQDWDQEVYSKLSLPKFRPELCFELHIIIRDLKLMLTPFTNARKERD